MEDFFKKVIFGLFAIMVILGVNFWNIADDRNDMKESLVERCGDDAVCLGLVNKHFDSCFEQKHTLAGSRRPSDLEQDAVLECFFHKAEETLNH